MEITQRDAQSLIRSFSLLHHAQKKNPSVLRGRIKKTGEIGSVTVHEDELEGLFREHFQLIFEQFLHLCRDLSPSALREVGERGVVLAGGMSQIPGIAEWISNMVQLPVAPVPRQHVASVVGASKLWSSWDKYSNIRLHTHG